jgi:integrase/recombinase XerD
MLRFWLAEKYITEAITFQMPRLEKKRLPYLSQEQFRKALKVAPTARDRAILLFLADSGIRRAEVLSLNWGDVNFQTGAVIFRRGKGRKERVTAIGARTRRALITYRGGRKAIGSNPLFKMDEGLRFTVLGLRSVLLGQRVGFPVSPHMLRRTCAVQSLRSGMDMVT